MKYIKLFEAFDENQTINESLNKDIKSFGSDLGKYLKNAGFDVKFLNGQISQEQRKSLNESKGIVALEVYQNDEMQTLNLYFNPEDIYRVEKIVNKFQLSTYYGKVIQKDWTRKQVSGALNPGDIYKGKYDGMYGFYRLNNVKTKVRNV